MGDFPERLGELHARMQDNWFEFLKEEVRTCFNALDFGRIALEGGDRVFAAKEVGIAENGYETIQRLLPRMESEERRSGIAEALPQLLKDMNALRHKLGMDLSHEM